MDNVTIRWVDGDELDVLAPILDSMSAMPLNKKVSRALVAFGPKDEVMGFHMLQLVPHAEPFFVLPEFRNTPVAGLLLGKMLEFLEDSRGFICVADNPQVEEVCKRLNMTRIDKPVYMMARG